MAESIIELCVLTKNLFWQSSEESDSNGGQDSYKPDFDGSDEPDKEYFEVPGSPSSDNADNNENGYLLAIFIIVCVVVRA